jgi:hypothetical protein
MPDSPERELDVVYSAIGEVLTDEEIELLVKQATGNDIYNEYAGRNDPRKIKIKKTIEALNHIGNERWLLTWVLIYAAAQERLREKQEKLREKIVKAFPKTLIDLPQAESHVGTALDHMQKVLNTPFPPPLKFQLRPKRPSFAEIVQSIVTLFGYKSLHEGLLLLLFTLSYNEALLANPADDVDPNIESIARQMDEVVKQAPAALALLGVAAAEQRGWVSQLTPFSAALRAAAGAPDTAAHIIDDIQRLVRENLSELNRKIFAAVQKLSFEPLMSDLPLDIENRAEFKNLVQAMRDLSATILARTLKYKMWQDAENQMSLVGTYFIAPDDAAGIADDWFKLQSRVDWLANLEPNEQWSKEAKEHAGEIETELFKEGQLEDDARMHFEAYRTWFRGPFKKIDQALTVDCGSLRKMDDPLTKILNEL